MSDFSLLSAGEREVLTMLAEGHTAKSAAEIKGLSVAAVNERLRAARRKLGASSSRELARALRLQENRDEEIELPPGSDDASLLPLPTISVGGRFLMSIATIVALTVAVITIQQNAEPSSVPAAPSATPDPLLGMLIDPSTNLSTMHKRVRAEVRDEAWASRTEAALRARYARVPHLASGGNDIRVICGSSVCEVAAAIPDRLAQDQASRLLEDLQTDPLIKDMRTLGLESFGQGFSDSFVSYWVRSKS